MRLVSRTLAALLLTAALALPARAQLLPSFGITGGLNFASLADATGDLDSSTGYHIGAYAELGFGGVSLRPAVLYMRAGDFGDLRDISNNALDGDVAYIIVPVDLKVGFPSPLLQPYVLAGPEFRFPAGSVSDVAELFGTDSRSMSVAGNVGVGAQLSAIIGPKVFAELRYGFDFGGLFEEQTVGGVTIEPAKVNLFMIRLGFGL